MSKKWEELTDQFDAESEDGQRVHILVYTTMFDAASLSNRNPPPVEGLKRIRTANGHHCNRIDDETFEIVELGLQVKKI